MKIRLTHLDGSLPNLALMKLAYWHRQNGDQVYFFKDAMPTLFDEDSYGRVYGSALFHNSANLVERFLEQWPGAIVSGTWNHEPGEPYTGPRVEQFVGDSLKQDYSIYPKFMDSIGFTQRGCRLKCGFCGVPRLEGENRSVSTIHDIWRGMNYPKRLQSLDNDFFGQPEWRERIKEIRDGGFRVCWSQGLNIRLIDEESAAALSTIKYRNTKFTERKLYTAWDQIGNEKVFFRGIELLKNAGIPPNRICAYMLCGYTPKDGKPWSWFDVWYRFKRMAEMGIEPFVMVWDSSVEDLKCFQRWANRGMYRINGCSWPEYERSTKSEESVAEYLKVYAGAKREQELEVLQ